MIRVLQNSCSHRGAEVCRERRGNSRLFVCPYHAWTFQNDGQLRGTSFPEGVSKGFDRKRMGLKTPPRMEIYRELVFVSFDRDIVDLQTYLGRAKEFLDQILDQGEFGTEIVEGTTIFDRRELEAADREQHRWLSRAIDPPALFRLLEAEFRQHRPRASALLTRNGSGQWACAHDG
jgi:hypothetical protein